MASSRLVAVVLLAGRSACAEPNADVVLAERLFQEGRTLLDAGQIHEACEKFAESQERDAGLGTLLNLAECHHQEHKVATALQEFTEAERQAAEAGDEPRLKYARTKISMLSPQLHSAVIRVRTRADGLQVLLDGVPLEPTRWGTDVPLDPGEHEILARAPGRKEWHLDVQVPLSGGRDYVEVPALEPVQASEPAPRKASRPPAADAPPKAASGGRTAGWIVGGAGVATLGVAGFLGLSALSNARERDRLCTPGVPCRNDAAFEADDRARSLQTAGFIVAGVGAAALGIGAWLVLSHEDTNAAALQVRVASSATVPASVELGGAF